MKHKIVVETTHPTLDVGINEIYQQGNSLMVLLFQKEKEEHKAMFFSPANIATVEYESEVELNVTYFLVNKKDKDMELNVSYTAINSYSEFPLSDECIPLDKRLETIKNPNYQSEQLTRTRAVSTNTSKP